MIPSEEVRARAAAYGVPENQIQRDHLISHVLLALSKLEPRGFSFFGGTALCRTWSDNTRLSEDIDLLVDDHIEAAERLPALIARGIRREFPVVRWIDMGRRHEVDTKLLDVGDEITLKIQFAKWRSEWRRLPLARTAVRLRYSDLPETVELEVPTPPALVTMKLLAWTDRRAPRDLFDLYDLAENGHITSAVRAMFEEIAGYAPEIVMNGERLPAGVIESWEAELGHQLAELPDPQTCLDTVRRALNELA